MEFKHAYDFKMTGKKSLFKNVLLFIKKKVPAIFELGTCGSVDRSYTGSAKCDAINSFTVS